MPIAALPVASVQLTVLGDAIIEADETLQTVCCQCWPQPRPRIAQILRQTGTFSIVNDDFAAITIDDVSGSESGDYQYWLECEFGGCRWVYPGTVQSDSGSAVEGVDFSSAGLSAGCFCR